MGIIHTAKKSIAEELYRKKKYEKEMITKRELSSREDVMVGFDKNNNILFFLLLSLFIKFQLKNSVEEEAKAMNLNQVCLCYQALKLDENGILREICPPVFSNSINNMSELVLSCEL